VKSFKYVDTNFVGLFERIVFSRIIPIYKGQIQEFKCQRTSQFLAIRENSFQR
jgi:hypothetical protein